MDIRMNPTYIPQSDQISYKNPDRTMAIVPVITELRRPEKTRGILP